MAYHQPGEIDWVTFVGSGESTLHRELGRMIRAVKEMTDLPVAVITNGALLYLPEIRADLAAADAVLPSLDAGDSKLYRQINRPLAGLTFELLLAGLTAFRREYPSRLWVEVMLVRGLNDTAAALEEIAAVLGRIQPDEVHILQPTRPPAETWVQPADEEGLARAKAILGDVARVILPVSGTFDLGEAESLVNAIFEIITRHPMREAELIEALGHYPSAEVTSVLEALEKSGKAQVVERLGVRFWSAAASYYPSE